MEATRRPCWEVPGHAKIKPVSIGRGEGKIFSAGHNLKEMTVKEGTEHHKAIFDQCNRLMSAIGANCVPVVAAVDGVAAAAGCQLVAMCDIAVATQKSKAPTTGREKMHFDNQKSRAFPDFWPEMKKKISNSFVREEGSAYP